MVMDLRDRSTLRALKKKKSMYFFLNAEQLTVVFIKQTIYSERLAVLVSN